jgi:hypothetical protein
MTAERNNEEPTEQELERTEVEFFAELASDRQVPFDREVVRKDAINSVSTEDFLLNDLFPVSSYYVEGDRRISHALIRWLGGRKEPTHLIGWWAPHRLLHPDELAEAEYIADLEPLLVERGVAEGAAQVKEDFVIAAPEEEHRTLLRLEPSDRAMYVVSEYRDRDGRPVLLRRQVMATGGVGRVRNLTWEKQHGGTYRFEY